jgi:WD40 repeat protein
MRCVDVSPCGRYFAAGGTSRTLRVCTLDWDSIEHRTLVPLPKHDEDEEQISQQHNVNIAVERVMHHSGSIFCTQFDATGDLLATGSNDKTIKVMRVPALLDQSNTETQDKWYDPKHDITLFGHNGTVRALSFRPASSQLISAGSGDSRLRLWDIKNASMDPLLQLDGHTQCVFALQISQKGSLILSGGLDGVVRAWDLRAGGCCVDEFHVDGAVSGLALSSTDTFFVAGLANGTISKVDLRAGRGPLWRHNTHTDDCRSVLFRDAEQTVLSASFDSTLCLSDCQTGHIKRHAPCHAGKIVALAAVSSPTGKCDIALSASSDRSVKLWRL